MATVPVPRTWTTGEIVTAAEMNTEIRDSVNFLLATPRCILYRSTDLVVGNSATPGVVSLDTELRDNDNMHTGAATRMIAKTAGRFEFLWYIHYPPYSANAGTMECGIGLNGAGTWGGSARLNEDSRIMCKDTVLGTSASIRAVQFMNVNDYVEFFTAQTSTVSQTIAGGIPFNMQASGRWIASS